LPHVPGTVLLNDQAAHAEEQTANLKHGTGRNSHIVLSPQPSDDPNDPLNWSILKKESILAILCLGAMLCAATNGPMLNASYFAISLQLNVTLTKAVLVSGYNILAIATIAPFVSAFSRKYGKRPVFVASTFFAIVGTAVAESKATYEYLLVGRIIMGFSTSAYESLIVSAVGDLYCVHQRGLRISIINFVLNSASSLASIICGQVYNNLGLLWLFHLFQIFLVIQFVLLFLFVPETTYNRSTIYETDLVKTETFEQIEKVAEEHREHTMAVKELSDPAAAPASIVPPKKTFVQNLKLYNGTFSNDSIFKWLPGMFLCLFNPAGFYSIIVSGLLCAWYVGSAIILAGIFAGPPWNFDAAKIGYLGTGPFVGGALASIVISFFGDWSGKLLTIKNKGTYEPEFRLVWMLPCALISVPGQFFFGYTMAHGSNAILCAFCQGSMMFGALLGIWATLAYGLDAFRSQSNEIFIVNMMFKVRSLFSRPYPVKTLTSFPEFHVLCSLEFRQRLGCIQRTRTDHVCIWRYDLVHVHHGNSSLYLRQETAQLVG
jgi:MFS family permease